MKKILIIAMLISTLILLSGCEKPDALKTRYEEYEVTIFDASGNVVQQYTDYYTSIHPDRSGVIKALTPDYRWIYISGGIVTIKETGNFYLSDQ